MTTEEFFTNLETAYAERLAKRAVEWQAKYPEKAREIRDAVAAQFRADPEPGSLLWQTREAAVVEAIRALKGWPTLREYVRLQAGMEPDPPIVPLRIIPPRVDRHDAKAK